jgi:hypothetical protein
MRRDDNSLSDASYEHQCNSFLSFLAKDINGYVSRGDSAHVDEFLQVVAVKGMEPSVLVGILRITYPHTDTLESREVFYDRVRSELLRVLPLAAVDELLRGVL